MKNLKKNARLAASCVVIGSSVLLASTPAQAGFFDKPFEQLKNYVEKEAIPTLKGERKVKIKPYIKVTSGKDKVKVDAKDIASLLTLAM